MQKICIYGLGAIGGIFAAKLHKSGYEVNAIARGDTLEAVKRDGLIFIENEKTYTASINATSNTKEIGIQDLIIISVKTTALEEITPEIIPMIGANTVILCAINGIPWWFSKGLSIDKNINLSRLDPNQKISQTIPTNQIIGCVTHLSASRKEKGKVHHIAGKKIIIGELGKLKKSDRINNLFKILKTAELDVEISENIHQEIWFKLWGNMTMNPASFLTSCTGEKILGDSFVRNFLSRCMHEASLIGEQIGLPIQLSPEERHKITEKLGPFKTSMLQDLESHNKIELDSMLTVVIDLANQLQIPVPNLETLCGLTRIKAQNLGLYP